MPLIPAQYLEETLALKRSIATGFLILGERFYNIHAQEMWKGEYDSYQDFLSEMDVSEATDSKLRTIYSRFVLEYKLSYEKLSHCPWGSLYLLASRVGDKEQTLALLEKAETLRREDFVQEIRALAVGEHECIASKTFQMNKCGVCKRLFRS